MRNRHDDEVEDRDVAIRPAKKKQASSIVVLLAALAAGAAALAGVRLLGPKRSPSTVREAAAGAGDVQPIPGAVPAQLNLVPSGNLVEVPADEGDNPAATKTAPRRAAVPHQAGRAAAMMSPVAGSPAPQAVPPQAVPPQAVPPQAVPPQAMPLQAMPPQAVPPQAAAVPQGYPAPAPTASGGAYAPIYYYVPVQVPQAAPPVASPPAPVASAVPAAPYPAPAAPVYPPAPTPTASPTAGLQPAQAPPIPPGATRVVAPPTPSPVGPPPGWSLGLRLAEVGQAETAVRSGTLTLGVLAAAVTPGGAADRAGLAAGDRIVAVGAQPVVSILHFFYLLAQQPAGTPIHLDVVRQGWLFSVELRDPPAAVAEVQR